MDDRYIQSSSKMGMPCLEIQKSVSKSFRNHSKNQKQFAIDDFGLTPIKEENTDLMVKDQPFGPHSNQYLFIKMCQRIKCRMNAAHLHRTQPFHLLYHTNTFDGQNFHSIAYRFNSHEIKVNHYHL